MKVITSLVALSLLGLSQLALADSMLIYNYRFAEGAHGWSADFADYPAGEEEFYELYAGIEKLPSYFDKQRLAFLLSGNNHSADLCMFLRKKVTKLKPNTKYKAFFQTTIASNATSDSFGIGGSPATSVFLKAGASVVRPTAAPASSCRPTTRRRPPRHCCCCRACPTPTGPRCRAGSWPRTR